MRCDGCDGTGIRFGIVPSEVKEPCFTCGGSGRLADDLFEEKLRAAVAKIGIVYFIRDDTNHRVKIGFSLKPLERLQALQTGSSVTLRLMAMCPGGRKVEKQFHYLWAERRFAGEWFDDRDREITRCVFAAFTGGDAIIWPGK